MTVIWEDEQALKMLKEKVDSVEYPLDEESYIDDSKQILKSILNDVNRLLNLIQKLIVTVKRRSDVFMAGLHHQSFCDQSL